MTTHKLAAGLALALMAAAQPSSATLPPGISGAWYNPAQPGHGLSVEILGDGRALAFWFVYDPAGNPVHLYLDGRLVDDAIVAEAFHSSGMRFGEFDPSDHAFARWGTVTLAFDSCNDGELSWAANGPAGEGYGDGSMPVVRLSAIAGLDCSFGGMDGRADAGKYHLEYPASILGGDQWFAAVDNSGQVWATTARTPSGGYVGPLAAVITGRPTAYTGYLALNLRYNDALAFAGHTLGASTEVLVREVQGRDAFGGSFPIPHLQQDFAFNEALPDPLERGFDTADLAGRTFTWSGQSQFFQHQNSVRFFADGSFCVDNSQSQTGECAFRGQLGEEEDGLAMFAFTGTGAGSYYVGKGWLEPVAGGGERVVLVAIAVAGPRRDGGLGVVGVEQ